MSALPLLPFPQLSTEQPLTLPSIPCRTHRHTHRHTHTTTEGESDPGFSGYGALCRTEIEECETDTNPHSAFSPNIRTMCPPTSCCCLVTKSRLTLCDPMNSSPPGSSVHGISRAWILEWVAIFSSRGSSQPRDRSCISCIERWILYHWATREAPTSVSLALFMSMQGNGAGWGWGQGHYRKIGNFQMVQYFAILSKLSPIQTLGQVLFLNTKHETGMMNCLVPRT